jgi:hypothetical protein
MSNDDCKVSLVFDEESGRMVRRSPQDIVNQTNGIAALIYEHIGYCSANATPKFYESTHPTERACWNAACDIQDLLTATDPRDALDELEDDQEDEAEHQEKLIKLPKGLSREEKRQFILKNR